MTLFSRDRSAVLAILQITSFALLSSFSQTASAVDVPTLVSYQGELTDISGAPVPDATYSIGFGVYDVPVGGTLLWSEVQVVNTDNGLFSAFLGAINPLDASAFDANTYLFLEITLGLDTLNPRVSLVSSPYALKAQRAVSADTANSVPDGSIGSLQIQNSSIQLIDIGQNGAADGQILKWQSGAWTIANDNAGSSGGWTDDGVLVRLNTTGDTVAVGSATSLGAKLGVDGTLHTTGNASLGPNSVAVGDGAFAAGNSGAATGDYASVSGGLTNSAMATGATVGGGVNNQAQSSLATVSGGADNWASGTYSSIGGGRDNSASDSGAFVGGGQHNYARGKFSFVGGGGSTNPNDSNYATGPVSVVVGGLANRATQDYSAVVGGSANRATKANAFVGGGSNNEASGGYGFVGGGLSNNSGGTSSVICGGQENSGASDLSTIAGGFRNYAWGVGSSVGGGFNNSASDTGAVVGGGKENITSGRYSAILGGQGNRARGFASIVCGGGWGGNDSNLALGKLSAVVGGSANIATSAHTFVGGGAINRAGDMYAVAAGGLGNFASGAGSFIGSGFSNLASGEGSVIGGGGGITDSNIAIGPFSVIGGGSGNKTFDTGSVVGGGLDNQAVGVHSTIGGGFSNYAQMYMTTISGGAANMANDTGATVGGGFLNIASGVNSSIVGGQYNLATNTAATVGGGHFNYARGLYSVVAGGGSSIRIDSNQAGGDWSTVSGGKSNVASGLSSVVGGGYDNLASGIESTVSGGLLNSATATGATVPGGAGNRAEGIYSFAAGRFARAIHNGSFVWSDTSTTDFFSTMHNEFAINAQNGFRTVANNTAYGGSVTNSGDGDGLRVFGNVSRGSSWGALYASNNGTSPAISATNASGPAGYFSGAVDVTGVLSKGGGSFKIDHPLDPENKYLQHSFVESPDMMNVYNGNVTLDAAGEATVTLPDWFEALNKEFRYQLTCIGGFAPVYISQEISGNSFKIAGGTSALKISWQLTGVRQDAFANTNRIQVEVTKPIEERGKYLHPKALGKPASRQIGAEKTE